MNRLKEGIQFMMNPYKDSPSPGKKPLDLSLAKRGSLLGSTRMGKGIDLERKSSINSDLDLVGIGKKP